MNAGPIRAARPADRGVLEGLLPAPGREGSLLPRVPGEWLLVAERSAGEGIVGCVRVRRGIGLVVPRYWYHVGCAVHAAPELGLYHRQRTLLLCNDLTGAWEIADLACDGESQDAGARADVLRGLLDAALDLVAGESTTGGDAADAAATVIVELPGRRDVGGRSPFWHSLGRHFYDGDPLLAAERHGPSWRTHVAALLPREPLLVSFLSPRAQAAIGCVAPAAEPLACVLRAAGLRPGRCVTIDEAGPVYEAALADLAAARDALRA
jgi:arginine N-succinyltransferase